MGRPVDGVDGVWARRSRHLPVVLSREEVRRLIAVAEGAPGLILRVLYGTGLRKLECLPLRVKDLDVAGGWLVVRAAWPSARRRTPDEDRADPAARRAAGEPNPQWRSQSVICGGE